MKLTLIFFLLAIVVSLGAGLWYLVFYERGNKRVLNALKVRLVLSAALIAFLILGYFQGWIVPQPGV